MIDLNANSDDEGDKLDNLPVEQPEDSDSDCIRHAFKLFADTEPDRARALSLHAEGHDQQDIAATIGRNPGATREYISQCRKKLNALLDKHCPGWRNTMSIRS